MAVWLGDNARPHVVTTRLGSFTVWAMGALLHSDFIGPSAWHCLLLWLSSFFLQHFFLDANLGVHLWLAKMVPVTGSAPWSLLCNPGSHCSIGLWVERAGMASGARKMWGRKQVREGERMKRTLWISVTSLFIGWWRATLCVYPWPSFFLIPPSSLRTLLYRMAFGAPSCPPRATLIPSASLVKTRAI